MRNSSPEAKSGVRSHKNSVIDRTPVLSMAPFTRALVSFHPLLIASAANATLTNVGVLVTEPATPHLSWRMCSEFQTLVDQTFLQKRMESRFGSTIQSLHLDTLRFVGRTFLRLVSKTPRYTTVLQLHLHITFLDFNNVFPQCDKCTAVQLNVDSVSYCHPLLPHYPSIAAHGARAAHRHPLVCAARLRLVIAATAAPHDSLQHLCQPRHDYTLAVEDPL
jgi:hypothetical protein